MPDRKYEKTNDRNYTLLDAKQRVIDLMANHQPLPEVGIYDEPVRYFKANEQWCKVIFGWLDWLEDVAGWHEAVDDNYAGIQAILTFEEGIEIAGEFPAEDNCDGFLTSAPFIQYAPQNPFNQPDYVPSGYLFPPFREWTEFETILPDWADEWLSGLIDWATGYQQGDIIVDIGSLPLFANWLDLLENGLPRIEINLQGTGEVELHLLAFPLGGRVVVSLDIEPNLADIFDGIIGGDIRLIELNRDLLSFPPELDATEIEEFIITEDGPHTIYIVFIPTVNDEAIPVNFGGGLRKIVLCGFEGEGTGGAELEDVRFNTENCTFEKRVAGVWSAIEGGDEWLACVPEGGDMATVEEICEAIECGFERVAARYLSGTVENLAGGDIVLTPGQAPVVVPPGQAPNDPTTTADEEARSGAAQGVYLGFRQMILDINSYIITQGLSEIDTHTRIASKYKTNDTMLAAITAYGAELLTPPANFTTPVITSTLASYIYCRGNSLSTLAAYVINTWDAEINSLLGLVNGLDDQQLDIWYNAGELVPSTDYLAYSCVPIESYDFTLTLLPQTLNDTHVFKKNHRYEIISEGYWLDSDGDLQDSFWTKVNNATEIFSTSLFNLQIGGAIKRLPTVFEAPYNAQHRYKWTIDMGTNDAGPQWNLLKWGVLNASINSPSGGIKISVKDLGEYTT